MVDLTSFEEGVEELGNRVEPTQFAGSDGFTDLIKFWDGNSDILSGILSLQDCNGVV
jgi:hypothetical protein